MKRLFRCSMVAFCLVFCLALSSCYAFLQADKLVYAGNVFKKPSKTVVFNDSIQIENE